MLYYHFYTWKLKSFEQTKKVDSRLKSFFSCFKEHSEAKSAHRCQRPLHSSFSVICNAIMWWWTRSKNITCSYRSMEILWVVGTNRARSGFLNAVSSKATALLSTKTLTTNKMIEDMSCSNFTEVRLAVNVQYVSAADNVHAGCIRRRYFKHSTLCVQAFHKHSTSWVHCSPQELTKMNHLMLFKCTFT